MRRIRRFVGGLDQRGVTLTELVVVLAIFGFLVAGIMQLWSKSQQAYFIGSELAEIQGDARVAIDQMARDIRKAGRDILQCAFDSDAYTDCSGPKLTRCQSLLGGSFTCNNVFIIPAASATSLRVQMDLDALIGTSNTMIDTSAPSEESITFALDCPNKRITRQQGTGTARALADNVWNQATCGSGTPLFTYEGPAPNPDVCTGAWGTITPSSQTARDCIQRVNITVVTRATIGGETVQRTMVTSVDLRAR